MLLQASVIVLSAPKGISQLTYEIPASLADVVQAGHRVLVPLRGRKMTAVVIDVSEYQDGPTVALKPILETLEPQPMLDRAHRELLAFLASYYMVPLSEVYQMVLPAALRVEARSHFKLVREPNPLELIAFTSDERRVIEATTRRPMTMRQLGNLAEPQVLNAALSSLVTQGLLERQSSVRGRHREAGVTIVKLRTENCGGKIRGAKQKLILACLAAAPAKQLSLEELESQIAGAKVAIKSMAQRGLIELQQVSVHESAVTAEPLELNPEQAAAFKNVAPAIETSRFETFLLWGVTASGKTEVYLQLAARCLERGRQVLILVPEIALADQLVESFRSRFGWMVALAHSGQKISERWSAWSAALSGHARIMIGPRSAIFAPIQELGLIIVDEEHDPTYKQEEGVRYNARDLAVALGGFSSCPVVLGSATPSAESFHNARSGRYRLLELPRRVQDRPLAAVEVIDLRQEFSRPTSADSRASKPSRDSAAKSEGEQARPAPLSSMLIEALRANLADGGQSLVFMNRRGYHNFLQCHLCGTVLSCPNCSVSMTFHLRDRSLRCHYCGHHMPAPESCPECRGFGLEGQGFGTERLTASLAEMLPAARIERLDADTSRRSGERSRIIGGLRRGAIDVLVGTQMITKGFDFPGVTLVGVVVADQALNMPDFRSAERTFQLLTQVAGRAGRGDRAGRVLIQTYAPHHYSIRAAQAQDYSRFIRRELTLRRELMYPPFARLALIRIEGIEPRAVEETAAESANVMTRIAQPETVRVLGPAPAPIERLRNRYRWQVMLKSSARAEIRRVIEAARSELAPYLERREVRWSVDIDPINML